jgi:hypothetical protein
MNITNEKIEQLEFEIADKKVEFEKEWAREYTRQTGIRIGSKVKIDIYHRNYDDIYIVTKITSALVGIECQKILKNGKKGAKRMLFYYSLKLIKEN